MRLGGKPLLARLREGLRLEDDNQAGQKVRDRLQDLKPLRLFGPTFSRISEALPPSPRVDLLRHVSPDSGAHISISE